MAAKAASNGGNNRVLPAMVAVQEHAIEAAAFLKSLANEQRLLILCCLLDGPLSVGEINGRVPLSQSALSQHLGVLREAGLVSTNRQSQTIYYTLMKGPSLQVMKVLYEAFCAPAASRTHTKKAKGGLAQKN
jgi:DNA-binding transcriptional ArsR family regulator